MILDEIVSYKRQELERLRPYRKTYLEGFRKKIETVKPALDFSAAITPLSGEDTRTRIIAEVKKASPSKGVIRADFYPIIIAQTYQANGASAVSVLTEERYFQGRLDFLTSIKHVLKIPVLRKDFIIDEYQVYESRAAGADAILLIAAILGDAELKGFMDLAASLGMQPLVEVHDEGELDRALKAGAEMIGINNRDLRTFATDVNTTKALAPRVPKGRTVVCESGINTREDILALRGSGVSAFLIGEALMREENIAKKLKELLGAGEGKGLRNNEPR